MSSRLLPGAKPTHNLTFRVTDEQHEAYRRAAAATGARTLSDWITRMLDEAAAAAPARAEASARRDAIAGAMGAKNASDISCEEHRKRPSKRSKP